MVAVTPYLRLGVIGGEIDPADLLSTVNVAEVKLVVAWEKLKTES